MFLHRDAKATKMRLMKSMKLLPFFAAILTILVTATFAEPTTAPATQPAKIVHITIDSSKDRIAISPYIYGVNQHAKHADRHPLTRIGGNRWTAYNWENNASNAGADWHHQSDDFLSKSDMPGEAVRVNLEAAARNKRAIIVTVPTCGYVSADKNADGDVNQTPDYLNKRFKKTVAKKNGPLSLKPDLNDAFVCQDEFVNWVENHRNDSTVFYSLDNEPDIWHATHARIHPEKVTYAEMVQKTTDYAIAIKDVKRDAIVFGAVNYGWNGYRTLQNSPDANDRDFHQFFLAEMKKAEEKAGRRLLDVIDVHWYPEATGDGVRVTGAESTPGAAGARMQAPRSLWDPTYVETSWITKQSTKGEPITMLTRLKRDIDAHYPGTKIAITEYNFGGGDHISGAIAQTDVLGIFAREGVFAACWWDENKGDQFINAAFDLFLNYDGKGSRFGDTSIHARTDDVAATSVYASVDSRDPSSITLVLINKTGREVQAKLNISHKVKLTTCDAFELREPNTKIRSEDRLTLDDRGYVMPAYSVTLMRLSP
jgi:hypothetical protein